MNRSTDFAEVVGSSAVMAILRGMGAERSLAVATAAWSLGITCVELPIQTPDDIEALRVVADAARGRGLVVGAGTVLTPAHVAQAVDAGAAFTVSPGLDLEIVELSHAAGLPSLPGVSSATEVQHAVRYGLTWLKAFPASVLGAEWFGAMRGPFPQVNFVATGGVDATNATAFLTAGARVVAVGSALEDPAQLPRLAALL